MATIIGVFLWHSGNPAIGDGWRHVVAYDRGRKYLQVLSTGDLSRARIAIEEWEADVRNGLVKPQPPERAPKVGRRLDERRRWFKRLGVNVPDNLVKDIAASLRL